MRLRNFTRSLSPLALGLALILGPSGITRAEAQSALPPGTYHDDKVALTLQPDGDQSYRGSITIGGTTYHLTAKSVDGNLSGSFADDAGNSYPFTAAFDGRNLDLTSGKTTHQLIADTASTPAAPANNAGIGVKLSVSSNGVVTITDVLPGGPADRAGIKPGDQIVNIDGQLHTVGDLATLMPGASGSIMKLTVHRGDANQDFSIAREVTNAAPPANTPQPSAESPAAAAAPDQRFPWLHQGLRLYSSWVSTVCPGHSFDFKEDEHGEARASDGTKLDAAEHMGTGAGGIIVNTVTCIDGGKVCLDTNTYFNGPSFGLKDPVSNFAPVSCLADINQNELWVDPARLAQARSDPDNHKVVAAVKWTIDGKTIDVIRITQVGDKHYEDRFYDAKSGLCLHVGIFTQEAPPNLKFHMVGETAEGDSYYSSYNLLGTRDVQTPWADEPMPQWTKQFKALHYSGQGVLTGPNAWTSPKPTLADADLQADTQGSGWMASTLIKTAHLGNLSPTPAKSMQVSGRDSYAGFFAGPAALAKLTKGQVLDTDPFTKIQTVVSDVDADTVTITAANASGSVFRTFNRHTGKVAAFGYTDGFTKFAWTMKLQSEE